MEFEMRHRIFKSSPKFPVQRFTEENPPSWLISDEHKWFWETHVLTLKVGKSIKTDFQYIRRIA